MVEIAIIEVPKLQPAALRHKDRYQGIGKTFDLSLGLLGARRLVTPGREADDAPPFEDYLHSPRDRTSARLITDRHAPLRRAALRTRA